MEKTVKDTECEKIAGRKKRERLKTQNGGESIAVTLSRISLTFRRERRTDQEKNKAKSKSTCDICDIQMEI